MIKIPVSVGELFDKITILDIKRERITEANKQIIILKEYILLRKIALKLDEKFEKNSDYKKLRKINISEVKTQLKNNGLLKVGSTAPAEILRQTYESSILAGLVKNNSEGTTYHNFMNEENNK